ncbi:hypothetical protein [Pontibacter cellulosilyticus]|uniref:HTTM-like domain-containing protein n=1 Tax=Pontibacter cellulosilyticus TaxID=1720253 RepID=A0A923SKE8_9BACT|nr:hypothetical protein [Pontibacter cellulosilyticus]MBC5993716.1 hypothetical protein [Pontibacter cellulosilyticus]
MFPLYNKVKGSARNKVTGLGLSVFRVFFSSVLFVEVANLFYFRHLYFNPIPYVVESELSFSLVLLCWLGVLLLLAAGFSTRIAAVVNYVLVLVFFSSFTSFKYHFDAALVGLSFMLMVLPVSHRLSLDSLRFKLRTLHEKERKVRQIYYFLPVLLVLGLQYFDSFFHKGASEVWLSGLGVWLPASLPNLVYTDLNWHLDQKVLMISLGYLVLLFEALFLFLLPFRKVRFWLIAIGISMHLSIAYIFPIPSFGVTFAGLYLLLLPVSFWNRISRSDNKEGKAGILIYCSGDKVAQRVKILLEHFDVSRNLAYRQQSGTEECLCFISGDGSLSTGPAAIGQAMGKVWLLWPLKLILIVPQLERVFISALEHGQVQEQTVSPENSYEFKENLKAGFIYFFIAYLVLAQLVLTLNSPLAQKLSSYTGTDRLRQLIANTSFPLSVFNSKLLGVTENIIFAGFREGSYKIIAVEYVAEDGRRAWLPIIDKLGMADEYSFGRMYTKWGRIIGAYPKDVIQLEEGLVRYVGFWAAKNQVSLQDALFVIKVREVDVVMEWRKDHLHQQMAKPWTSVGALEWKGQEPHLWLNKP